MMNDYARDRTGNPASIDWPDSLNIMYDRLLLAQRRLRREFAARLQTDIIIFRAFGSRRRPGGHR